MRSLATAALAALLLAGCTNTGQLPAPPPAVNLTSVQSTAKTWWPVVKSGVDQIIAVSTTDAATKAKLENAELAAVKAINALTDVNAQSNAVSQAVAALTDLQAALPADTGTQWRVGLAAVITAANTYLAQQANQQVQAALKR